MTGWRRVSQLRDAPLCFRCGFAVERHVRDLQLRAGEEAPCMKTAKQKERRPAGQPLLCNPVSCRHFSRLQKS